MLENVLVMESSLSDAFDMKGLRLQALTHAAKLSRITETPVSIGPHAQRPSEEVVAEPAVETKAEISYDDSQWDRWQLNESVGVDLDDSTTLLAVQSVAHNMYMGEMEKLRREMVRQDMKKRMEAKRIFTAAYREKIEAEAEAEAQEKANTLQRAYEERVKNALRDLERQNIKFAEEDAKRLKEMTRMKEARKAILMRQAEKSKIHQLLDMIQGQQKEIRRNVEQYEVKLSELDGEFKNTLKASFDEQFRRIVENNAEIMKSGRITESELNQWTEARRTVEELLRMVDEQIMAQKKISEANAAAAAVAAQLPQRVVPSQPFVHGAQQPNDELDRAAASGDPDLTEFISAEAQRIYSAVDRFHHEHEEKLRAISQDKQFVLRVKLAVVPTLTKLQASNLNHELQQLVKLFSGQQIMINNKTAFSAAQYPQGVEYCQRFVAEQVLKCEDIRRNLSAYATAIVSLSSKFPDFAKLFRYYLYKLFPATVPYSIPQYEDQSSEDYKRTLGYNEGESLKNYLDRLTAITMLYAQIMITEPRHGETNPFGPENGWRWLVDVLSRDPLKTVTATVIKSFLEVAGNRLVQVYGRQFLKLLHFLQSVYLPRLAQMDANDLAYLNRLTSTLEGFAKTGRFERI